jgi:hypothetical protein
VQVEMIRVEIFQGSEKVCEMIQEKWFRVEVERVQIEIIREIVREIVEDEINQGEILVKGDRRRNGEILKAKEWFKTK